MTSIKLFCFIFFAMMNVAFAQENANVFRVKSGSNINRVIPFEDQYQYGQFMDGEVYFRGGRISKAKLNYNFIHCEVMFIALNRDTLLLTDPAMAERVIIGETLYLFVPGQGHVEIVGEYDKAKLGRKQFFISMGSEKYAAYGQYSSTSSIASYMSYTNHNGQMSFLEGQDKIVLKRRAAFYLIDRNNRYAPLNRASLMKFFPSRKSEIARFLKENAIDMEKEPDVIRTLEFCSTI